MHKTTVRSLCALVLVMTSACHFSKVSPTATVRVSGRALDASGTPLPHARVLLFKEADLGEVFFGAVAALSSLGTVCLLPQPPTICSRAHTATTGGDGRYSYTLTGEDTQGSIGTESTLDVVLADPQASGSGGATTTVQFVARGTTVTLPDARLWGSVPKVSQSVGAIGVSWSALPANTGTKASYAVQAFLPEQQGSAWSQPATPTHADVDPRILEDQPATLAVSARTTLSGGSDGGTVHASYLSAKVAVRATAGTPPSRGRTCAAVVGTNPPTLGAFGVCGATDGHLSTPARVGSSGSGKAVVTGVAIDLGSSRPITLVETRGVSGQFVVDVSDDHRTWRTVATDEGDTVAMHPRVPTTARYVRVRSTSGLDESLLDEVSVW